MESLRDLIMSGEEPPEPPGGMSDPAKATLAAFLPALGKLTPQDRISVVESLIYVLASQSEIAKMARLAAKF